MLREIKTTLADERELLGEYLALSISLDELFSRLFYAYNRYLAFYLRRRGWSNAAAEDLLQQSWVTLWRDIKRGSFFERGSSTETPAAKPVLTFLIKTCENLGRNLYRHEHHFPSVSLEELDAGRQLCAADLDEQIQLRDVRRAMFELCTEDERRVLHLLSFGLDRVEIAEIVGEKPHWVDNRRRSAVQKLRGALGERAKR